MRLLQLDDNGELSLIQRASSSIPGYAILSHTWGADSEEVTFEDLVKDAGKQKAGYGKIRFCAKQADLDGLKYFWVDTCCIDKSSSAEVSEAINSMFRWYREATRCYVYLSDVPDPKDLTSTVESAFPDSRWFKRGWTLQELIAPSSVQIFSRNGELLGNKKSREQQIHQITGIAIAALQGTPLSQFDIAERLLWAARRETKVEEDAAYCLLGIFDIHMPLIYGEGQEKALDRLQRKVQKSSNPTSLVSKDAPWIVPFERNPRFTGRESQLAQLEEKLFAKDHTTKIAITGLGGMGKTQLVLELLYRTKAKHRDCSIIWIPATSVESLHQGYLDVAQQLGIPGWEEGKADVRKLVQKYLSKDDVGQWLLVFDNADDIDMWIAKAGSEQESDREMRRESHSLIDCLPRSKQGCIVFTTRDGKTAVKLTQQNVINVPEMDEEAATQLLKNCLVSPNLVENQQDARALLGELTYLPLAIVQAAAYINENRLALADHLSLLEEKEEEIIDLLSEEFEDDGRYCNVKNPVATTWLISFEQIRRRDPLAAEYLSFMACVDPRDIPQSLLPPGPSREKETDAIGTLNAYCFVSRRPVDLALDLHRLVHLATRNWLRKEGLLALSMEKVIVRLEEVFPNSDHKNRSVWRTYLPHARYALESDIVNKDSEKKLALIWRYGKCLYKDGRWNEAEASFTQVLETYKRVLGDEHRHTLRSIHKLASTYRNQGRWDVAEELEVQVMETRKRKLGADHPDTLTSIANLASTYGSQGRWDAAEELEVQVVETRKRKLRADHPDTLSSMNNLAFTWKGQGRDTEAVQLMKDCVQLQRRVLGVGHPRFLSSSETLAKWQAKDADIGASA
jgi:tetratricopeptide (TPR) repeat protein